MLRVTVCKWYEYATDAKLFPLNLHILHMIIQKIAWILYDFDTILTVPHPIWAKCIRIVAAIVISFSCSPLGFPTKTLKALAK